MSFSWAEILRGIASALIYGGFFALLISFAKTCLIVAEDVFKAVKSVFLYDGRLFAIKSIHSSRAEPSGAFEGEILPAFLVILYTVGFCVASYIGYDGEVRIYTLLLSLCAFYLTKNLMSMTFERLFFSLFVFALHILIPIFRLVFYPVRWIFLFILPKIIKNAQFERIYRVFCHNLLLDNRDKRC